MKTFMLWTLLFSGVLAFEGRAQDAAALADRDAAEERYKKLNSTVESLIEENASLRKKVQQLSDRLGTMRDEHAKSASDSSVQDDLKRLAEKIQEVDRKREGDMKQVASELERIAKLVAGEPLPSKGHVKNGTSPKTPGDSDRTGTPKSIPTKGYTYKVQQGDYLGTIISAYNAEFKKNGMKAITQQQVLDANPGLNPNKMGPGREIFIPMPEPK
ncbi:MAG: hypothetical protein H7X97_01175 [Opitutaceae bacterium]|nr:hypothetical protein [Verrucomicrobiales bacterium]